MYFIFIKIIFKSYACPVYQAIDEKYAINVINKR